MQQIQFVREGIHSYMVISANQRLNRMFYKDSVLEFAQVPNFLNYEIREMDGEQTLYYRLKYRTSLKQVLDDVSFTLDKVKNMVCCMVYALQQAENFLLNPDCIVWKSDCTFIEVHTGNLLFTYYPDDINEKNTLKDFVMELIQYVDKSDSDTYMYVMEFYDIVTDPDCTLELLLQFVKGESTVSEKRQGQKKVFTGESQEWESFGVLKKQQTDVYKYMQQENNLRNTELADKVKEDKECKENKKNKQNKKNKENTENKESTENKGVSLVIVILTVVNLLVAICLVCEIWTYQYIWVLVVTVFLLLISLIIYFRTDEDDPDKIMEDYRCDYPDECKKDNVNSTLYMNSEDNMHLAQLGEMETTILTAQSDFQQVVVEDTPKTLYLKSMQPKEYQDIFLEKKSVVLGSMSGGCDYLLRKKGISRMHAKILKKEDGLYLLDLNSTNGTFLNEAMMTGGKECQIQNGDVISFAHVATFVVMEHEEGY